MSKRDDEAQRQRESDARLARWAHRLERDKLASQVEEIIEKDSKEDPPAKWKWLKSK